MGTTLVELSDERNATAAELRQVRELEQQLGRAKHCMAVERAARDELEVEASRRAHELQEAQAKVIEVTSQVEVFHKQLDLLKGESSKFEVRVVMA